MKCHVLEPVGARVVLGFHRLGRQRGFVNWERQSIHFDLTTQRDTESGDHKAILTAGLTAFPEER